MTIRTWAACGLLLAAAAPTPSHAENPRVALDVVRAKVAFAGDRARKGDPDATLTLRARYDALRGPSHFEFHDDDLSIAIAGTTFDLNTSDAGVRVRGKGTKLWYHRPRDAEPSGLRSLFIDVRKGVIRARIDLADDAGLRATGAWSVPVDISLRTADLTTAVDLRASRSRRRSVWTHGRRDRADRPLPLQLAPGSEFQQREAGNAVIRDVQAWAQLWSDLGGTPERLPIVDFGEHTVLAVALGGRTGVTVSLDRVRSSESGVEIVYTEHVPGPTCVVLQAVSYPVALAKVPASTVPGSEGVAFLGRERRVRCGR